jgi:ammonium transporter, Amt family
LVAITAPCAFVQPWAAAVIGSIAAILVIEVCWFIEKRGIDDPVGAIGVHGVGGTFGVLCIGIFSSGDYGAGWNLTTKGAAAGASGVTGILYDQGSLGFGQLGAQAIGAVVIWTVIFGFAFAFFKIQNALTKGGIRPTKEVEELGMDLPEMGALAYDNLVLNELDIVGAEGVTEVHSGGPSPDPTIGR